MGKKKKNSNYNRSKEDGKVIAAADENKLKRFEPRDILCILAALLFIGSWIYNNQVGEIPMGAMAAVYIGIAVLLGLYFFISPKFQATWKKWNTHVKLYLVILIIGDILAFLSYDIMSNIVYLAVFIAVNYLYYYLFLRNRTEGDTDNSKNKNKSKNI